VATGLKAVDNVLSFAKTRPGKPSAKERSLFVAPVALSYAVWESFAEDVDTTVRTQVEGLVGDPPWCRERLQGGCAGPTRAGATTSGR
jgi:hypothetical protein